MLLWHIVDATRRIGSAGVQPERLGWPVNCNVHSLAPAAGFSCWRSLLNASAITAQSEKLLVQLFDEVATLTFLAGVPLQGFDWLQSSFAFVPNA